MICILVIAAKVHGTIEDLKERLAISILEVTNNSFSNKYIIKIFILNMCSNDDKQTVNYATTAIVTKPIK